MKPIFKWEKTRNPYLTIDEEPEDSSAIEDFNSDYIPSDDEINEMEEEEEPVQGSMKSINGILTPLGYVPLTEYTDTFKVFNFWTCHTNFGITKGVEKIIEDCEGVEILHVFTRYRFRIAVGKAFKVGTILHEIPRRVRKYLKTQRFA